ncbi:MAG: arginase family protein [Planctomycetota bacterium]|jgi:arginase
MPLATILGRGPKDLVKIGGEEPSALSAHTAIVGVRDLDPGERALVRELGVTVFTMRDIDERSMKDVMEDALAVVTNGTAGFHVSFDLDWLDPKEAPGVGTPVLGGATYREGHLAMEMIADTGRMRSLEVVEVNPVLDSANQTASLAVEMVLSAYGKQIL